MSASALIPLLAKMGEYFKAGADYYAGLKVSGADTNPEVLTGFILLRMADWNPKVKGREVLDEDTKQAGARLLAGLIINLAN